MTWVFVSSESSGLSMNLAPFERTRVSIATLFEVFPDRFLAASFEM